MCAPPPSTYRALVGRKKIPNGAALAEDLYEKLPSNSILRKIPKEQLCSVKPRTAHV